MLITTAISEIRRGCGRPHEAELGDDSVLLELWQALTYYRAVLNLTHEAWTVKRWDFTVASGTTTEMEIDSVEVPDFGSEIFIQSKDDTNPYFLRRTINCVRPEQMTQYYSGPTNLVIGSGWLLPHVAAVFSIFRESDQWMIQWLPAHAQDAEYTLWYISGASTTPPLFTSIATTDFPIEDLNWLIVNDSILNLFPHLADPETGLNPKQQALFDIAKKKVEQWTPVLEARRWDGPRREQTQHRKVYGQKRYGYGGGSSSF
jgi:hypothetical protein